MTRAFKVEFWTQTDESLNVEPYSQVAASSIRQVKDNYFRMTRTKTGRFLMGLLLTGMVVTLAQSCSSSKRCGCGTDINGIYRPHKRFFGR